MMMRKTNGRTNAAHLLYERRVGLTHETMHHHQRFERNLCDTRERLSLPPTVPATYHPVVGGVQSLEQLHDEVLHLAPGLGWMHRVFQRCVV